VVTVLHGACSGRHDWWNEMKWMGLRGKTGRGNSSRIQTHFRHADLLKSFKMMQVPQDFDSYKLGVWGSRCSEMIAQTEGVETVVQSLQSVDDFFRIGRFLIRRWPISEGAHWDDPVVIGILNWICSHCDGFELGHGTGSGLVQPSSQEVKIIGSPPFQKSPRNSHNHSKISP